jgi:hypothetical protein
MSLYNVDNVKKVIKAVAEVGNMIGGVLEDGKFTAADTKEVEHLWPIITELSTTNYSLILPEIKDVDAAEGQEIIACFTEDFDIPQDNIENPLEYILKFLSMGIAFVIELIKMIKNKPVLL